MAVKRRSKGELEYIARNTLSSFDPSLLSGEPSAVPIEKLAHHLGLDIEYQCIRKNGVILGELVYNKTLVAVYHNDLKKYGLIEVEGKTIILDESLLGDKQEGRLRFTCAHEISHWLLHQYLYSGSGLAAAYGNPQKSSQEDLLAERQANQLATLLLMPTSQVKKAFYRHKKSTSSKTTDALAKLFGVSYQAMSIYLEEHNLG